MTIIFAHPLNATSEWLDLVVGSSVMAVVLDIVSLLVLADLIPSSGTYSDIRPSYKRRDVTNLSQNKYEHTTRDSILKVCSILFILHGFNHHFKRHPSGIEECLVLTRNFRFCTKNIHNIP